MKAEIIAIGSELLTPFRQDTNSLYLTEKLNQLGVEVAFKTVVGDSRENLTAVARIAVGRAEILIFMGGLGPTEDDLTREAVAAALELPLERDETIISGLQQRFAKHKMKMAENNAKQADIIAGATVLPNRNGTAPGQWLSGTYDGTEKMIILLPGPPHELKPMFDSRYVNVQTTILAHAGEIELHLRARADSLEVAQERVDELAEKLEDELDDFVFSTKGESLEQIVGYYLQMRGATLAVAESCTGGLIGERITSVGGSSRYFPGGAMVYSNELKTTLADVPKSLIKEHGAVSGEVAAAMAEGIRLRCKATWGLAVTGIAGPTGGTPEKPVGLVFHALSNGQSTEVVERKFPGDRDRVRWWASQQALDMVRRKLM